MKLSHRVDLESLRAQAHAQVDRYYNRVSAGVDPTPLLHAAKARAASEVGPEHPALVAEAATRSITPEALCESIIQKNREQQEQLLLIEGQRQWFKTRIAAATTGQDLTAIIQSHQ